MDWFTFTLAEESLVSVAVTFGGNEPSHFFGVSGEIYGASSGHPQGFYFSDASPEVAPVSLPAGTYYLQLAGTISAPSRAYRLAVGRAPVPDSAYEPNNSAAQATPIAFDFSGEMYFGQGDEDWFTFTLQETRIVTFDLGDSYYAFALSLYDGQLAEVPYGGGHYGGEPLTRTLTAGRYFLQVHGSYQTLAYPLHVKSAALPDSRYEPNNSFNASTPITLPFAQELYVTPGDEDWFAFTLTSERLVSFDLGRGQENPYGVSGALYRSGGTQVEGFHMGWGKALAVLPAGSYRLKVVGNYGENFAYSLAVSSEAVPTAFEPNNSREQAYGVALGFRADNLLVSSDDEDWFTFSLSSATQVSLTLERLGGGHLSAYLENGRGEAVAHVNEGVNAPVLAAGTYYLRFLGYSPVKYKFSLVRR